MFNNRIIHNVAEKEIYREKKAIGIKKEEWRRKERNVPAKI